MTQEQELARALAPLVDRVSRSSCWVKRNGKLSHLKQPLSDVKLARHIAGPHAYGAAPIAPGENTTCVALLDFDSHKGEVSWLDMQDVALSVMCAAEDDGLTAIPFRSSGGAGIHLYFLWDAPQDAFSVREALRIVLARVGLSVGVKGVAQGEVELFPKQSEVPADGVGNMFVLPCAGQSVPLDTFELEPLQRSALLNIDWPLSAPVAQLQRPEPQLPATVGEVSVELATLRAALDAIPNSGAQELDYDTWRNVIFALHDATGGSDEGLALAHDFSARSSKYDGKFLDERVWPYVRSERDGQTITARTILHLAREHGWTEDVTEQFDIVEAPAADSDESAWPNLERDRRGAILPTMENACKALACPAMTGWKIAYDNFRAEIMRAPVGTNDWRALRDSDITALRMIFEQRGFKKATKEMVRDAVDYVAEQCEFDSAQLWLTERIAAWDGVPRIGTFLRDYLRADDTPYTRAVSRYIWTALAGRTLDPGCEAPMVPVLIGSQGCGKTRSVKALVPSIDAYCELNLAERDADASRSMRGRLVIELGELRGLRSRDAGSIKAFISRTHESWTPKYREFATHFARRFVFFGTTNEDEFLDDSTGERRWLPVRVGQCDVAAILRDREQLWAEARELVLQGGVDWREAEQLAPQVHGEHKMSDAWVPVVAQWLNDTDIDGETPRCYGKFTTLEVLTGAFGMNAAHIDRRAQMRAADAIKMLGYIKVDGRLDGRKQKYWTDPLI